MAIPWSWTSEEKMGGQTMKGRYTVKIKSPSTYDMKYEMSSDGATWNTVMEGKAKKKEFAYAGHAINPGPWPP